MKHLPQIDHGAGKSEAMSAASNSSLRSFVQRIRQKKADARAVNEVVRAIYAEAKEAGLDKTALGEVVAYIEKREKNPDALAERSALFERYLVEYDGMKSATHAHAGVSDVTPTQRPRAFEPVRKASPAAATEDQATTESSAGRGVARPDGCLKPEACGSMTWRELCHSCKKAAASPTLKAATSMEQG